MSHVHASAPGKAVLSGEYAVLQGAPAICMAVNNRAIVTITPVQEPWHSVSAPGYSSTEGRFVSDGAAPEWLQGEDEYQLVDVAWRALGPGSNAGLAIELDTRAFFDDQSGAKLGLGSSAALTVALTAALMQSTDVCGEALNIHREFQAGAGSGVDIATSVRGGLLEYRMQGAQSMPLPWPTGLDYRLVWTGAPASTAGKLQRFQSASPKRSYQALISSAAGLVDAWQSASGILAEMPGYVETLRQFSDDYNLGIFEAGHDKLVAAAQAAGLVYKPCGAGGGDVGILLGTQGEQLDEFLAAQPEFGCRALESTLEMQGVAWEQC
jgi:phosphomevalonate kinase